MLHVPGMCPRMLFQFMRREGESERDLISVPTQGSYSHQELTNKERDYQIYEQMNKNANKSIEHFYSLNPPPQ